MEKRPTYEELQAQVRRMAERIAYLERLLWGGKRDKRDKGVAQGPTLFDEFFNEAAESKEAAIAETVREIRKEAEKRRSGSGRKPERPERYLYAGLPEEWRTEYPQGVNLAEYDIIGRVVTRILHRTPARVWVECVDRPVLRKKGEKDIPFPSILQAPAPVPVLGGGACGRRLPCRGACRQVRLPHPRIPPGEDVRGRGGEAFHLHPQ